jgi:hypothetical protein
MMIIVQYDLLDAHMQRQKNKILLAYRWMHLLLHACAEFAAILAPVSRGVEKSMQ